MPVVEVACPACGARFKAPDTMAGKKAKCKKCDNVFRVPGAPAPDSAGDGAGLTANAPAAAPRPVKDVAALPSADPFDFSKPAAAPARPVSGAKPAPAPAAPAAKPAAPPPAQAKPASKPVAPPEPEPLPEPLPAGDDPFAFGGAPAASKKKGRAEDEEPPKAKKKGRDEEDEQPKAKKKRRDEDEEDEPRAKKKPAADEQDEEPAPKKKRPRDENEEGEDEPRAKKKPAADEPYNPFADYEPAAAGEVVTNANPWDDEPKGKKKKADDKGDAKGKKRKGDEEDDEPEKEKPRYRRPEEKRGLAMSILITGVIGLVALGLGVAAVVTFIKQNRPEPEQVKEEKKEEPPVPPEVPGAPVGQPGAANPAEPKAKEPEPKAKEPEAKDKDKGPELEPGMTRPPATVARPRPFTVGNLPAKPEPADKPGAGMVLDVAAANVRRVFPPANPRTDDTAVLIQSSAGVGGAGEKLALDFYGPAGNRVAADRIEYDGDGLANPIADFTVGPDKKAYFLAATGGKLHVWSVADKSKIAEGVSPYADKPEHAKSGLAAAFFTADPNRVILVSTAGAVLLYDLPSKKPVKDFIPPHGSIGRVSLGRSAAKTEDGRSVAVAVGGVLYQLKADPSLGVVQKYDLGGDVYRSLGLAVVGTPGRLVYAFEGRADGKKETLALGLPAGTGAKPVAYRFPAASAGEPKGALWAGENFAGVATDRGVVWFDDHDKKFLPMLFTQPPAAGHYFGDDKFFWYVIPHPKEDGKSVLAALPMPPDAFESYTKKFAGSQPVPAARIDAKGLAK